MFADDVAAGGAEDIADKEDIHLKSLHGVEERDVEACWMAEKNPARPQEAAAAAAGCGSFFAWHRAGGFN